jgi:hypothetical protein
MHAKSLLTPALGFFLVITLLHPGTAISGSSAFFPSQTEAVSPADESPSRDAITRLIGTNTGETRPPDSQPGVRSDANAAPVGTNGTAEKTSPDEVLKLKERILELQNKGKLGFRKIVACRSVEGFGAYSPIEPGQAVDKVVFYCEPANVSTLNSGDRYIIDCSVDFLLMDSLGKVVSGKENALRINRVSRSPIMDLYFKVEMRLRKGLDQSVVIKTVLHDKIKNETVSVTNRVNVEAGAKKKLEGI